MVGVVLVHLICTTRFELQVIVAVLLDNFLSATEAAKNVRKTKHVTKQGCAR